MVADIIPRSQGESVGWQRYNDWKMLAFEPAIEREQAITKDYTGSLRYRPA